MAPEGCSRSDQRSAGDVLDVEAGDCEALRAVFPAAFITYFERRTVRSDRARRRAIGANRTVADVADAVGADATERAAAIGAFTVATGAEQRGARAEVYLVVQRIGAALALPVHEAAPQHIVEE